MNDAERLTALIEPVVERAGAELVDVEVGGAGGRPVVRAYIDVEGGVSAETCARVSRLVERALEDADAVPERYVLEVSSPGLDRPLTRRGHFERFVGRDIEVRLYRKRGGRKNYVGTLEDVHVGDGGRWQIVVAGPESERWTFTSEEIARARLHVSW